MCAPPPSVGDSCYFPDVLDDSASWSYEGQQWYWPDLCTDGERQSPINIPRGSEYRLSINCGITLRYQGNDICLKRYV
jgi:carbonic anhydrase